MVLPISNDGLGSLNERFLDYIIVKRSQKKRNRVEYWVIPTVESMKEVENG